MQFFQFCDYGTVVFWFVSSQCEQLTMWLTEICLEGILSPVHCGMCWSRILASGSVSASGKKLNIFSTSFFGHNYKSCSYTHFVRLIKCFKQFPSMELEDARLSLWNYQKKKKGKGNFKWRVFFIYFRYVCTFVYMTS